jgi:hypothetical protein
MSSGDPDLGGNLDETLTALYHASRSPDGRVDPRKVVDDADAYYGEHPDLFAAERRKLLAARVKVIDRRLQVQPDDVLQLTFDEEPRYFVVGASARVEAEHLQPTDWDAWYGIHLDDYVTRVAAHQKTNEVYRRVKGEWAPGEPFAAVVGRLRGRKRP